MDALLQWVQSKIPHKNVKDFTNSWRDGTALCELVDVLKPGTILNAGSLSKNNPFSNATLGIVKAEEQLEIPMILAPEDMVAEDNDVLSIATYISYFRDYEERKTPDPGFCTAFGHGLESGGSSHQPAKFTIVAKSCFNEQLKVGGTPFVVDIIASHGKDIPCDVKDNSDGSYTSTYTPTDAGQYIITIALAGVQIKGSPWRPDIP